MLAFHQPTTVDKEAEKDDFWKEVVFFNFNKINHLKCLNNSLYPSMYHF